ncbi:phage tail protein [Methylobacterium sp. NFXW15]|uniref:phage tail protein n=1 Tax=Methylobacterium sp. NFXW15 TaxID=2819512 RepID=UPI003CFB7D64
MAERIGLNPQDYKYDGQAVIAVHQPFDDEPFYQPTAMGEETLTITLATRPHVFGGLRNWEILRAHMKRRDVVPFVRLYGIAGGLGFPVGELVGDVLVRHVTGTEGKSAPDGLGYRHEFTAELVFVGQRAGGF